FFQAEDGIRDFHVTGVQTCALPILKQVASNHKLDPEELVAAHQGAVYLLYFYGFIPGFMYLGGLPRALHTPRKSFPDRNVEKGRSEERRVGKECRSGRAETHQTGRK